MFPGISDEAYVWDAIRKRFTMLEYGRDEMILGDSQIPELICIFVLSSDLYLNLIHSATYGYQGCVDQENFLLPPRKFHLLQTVRYASFSWRTISRRWVLKSIYLRVDLFARSFRS